MLEAFGLTRQTALSTATTIKTSHKGMSLEKWVLVLPVASECEAAAHHLAKANSFVTCL